ncbi:hypothetical protein K1T71_001001 [Dendrolimus kikuchii]|uniref:Uncharacterized protein n=1 Tax=Dendrolimus kikuchii TaxID=765133 RepID=A0ACC1DGT5_9NEOP|nr:hypothetical protein K1T71_001001 [Dendrolimus kikuchii]
MFLPCKRVLICVILFLFIVKTCTSELPSPPQLVLYIPGDPEYTDVLARREHDDLTLTCKLRGEVAPTRYVWNYIPADENAVPSPYTVKTESGSSSLVKLNLSLSDSGQYFCTVPPFSASKNIVVQSKGPMQCARGAFWCGKRCVLATYVCDGFVDCEHGEDEHIHLCNMQNICQRSDKLNCSSGRCISESACCLPHTTGYLCRQPACCDEYPRYSRQEGFVEFEYPPLFDDRHAPDDYGFIQSTIYTVTACALIFMIAVVLLVSAICKMHMKRAALRSYAHAERATRHHYNVQYAQCNSECPPTIPRPPPERPTGMGLARLSAIFSSRYRQVPTHPPDVEMTLRSTSLNNSPTRQIQNYRSPTYCDINTEYLLNSPDSVDCARNLNIPERPRRNTLERVIDHIDRQRLTLQVGRFQLTLPNLPNITGFRRNSDRPDTPNVTEVDLQDLDFVRLGSNDTYTLNGRTIRLLGANFENYPIVGGSRPPPYTEAMRYKLYGPPPEYLSREGLNSESQVDQEARSNIEMPPCYDEVNGNQVSSNNNSDLNTSSNVVGANLNSNNIVTISNNVVDNNSDLNVCVNDLTAISNDTNNGISVDNGISNNTSNVTDNNSDTNTISNAASKGSYENNNIHSSSSFKVTVTSHNSNDQNSLPNISDINNGSLSNNNIAQNSTTNSNFESLNSVIDNLPAIDSDVNAN